MTDIKELKRIASQVRRDIVRQVYLCQSGHPGGSLGNADILVALYFEVMKHDTSFNMEAKDEDVFFLSNGHISPVWYSTLARAGYFPVEELRTFRQIDSRLQGHPTTHEGLPGIRVASGSLGQGISVACGMAKAKKMNGDDRTVFVLSGDGEQQEGQVWEAALFAPDEKLDNLVLMIDDNGQQIDGPTKDVMYMGSFADKYKAFGWDVMEMNGNDMEQVVNTLKKCQTKRNGQPTCIVTKTEMGMGVDYMMGSHKWHGSAPDEEQTKTALSQLEETLGDFPAPEV